jgi:hypothetical protein
MSEEGIISNLRELIAGIDRQRIWIMAIGLMGILFAAVFTTIMILLDVLRPAGLVTTTTVRPIIEASIWIFSLCSIISVIAGVKVLNFIRSWHKNYSNLKAAQKEFERKHFGN